MTGSGSDTSSTDPAAVEAALRETAEPLAGVDPERQATGDLQSFDSAVAAADVVGLGEPSHGTKAANQFRHRLTRYLVTEHDYRLITVEASFAAMLDANEYVCGGSGTPEELLSGAGFHPLFANESLSALLEWLRSFNEGRETPVQFHGIDNQSAVPVARRLESFFQTVDPNQLMPIESALETLRGDSFNAFGDDEALSAHLAARMDVIETLGEALDNNEDAYVDAADRRQYDRAKRLVWSLDMGQEQYEAIQQGRTESGANIRIRDSAMAAQIQWLRSHTAADRAVVLGHNAHLSRGWFAGVNRQGQRIPSVGHNLASLSGVDYHAIGLLTSGGTVGAVYAPELEYRAYELDPPQEGAICDRLEELDQAPFRLALSNVSSESPLAQWLDSRPPRRVISGGYRNAPEDYLQSALRSQFDDIVFLGQTEATRPLPGHPRLG